MNLQIKFFFFLLFPSGYIFSQKEVRLNSPDAHIVFAVKLNEGIPVYSVAFKKNELIEKSSINLDIEGLVCSNRLLLTGLWFLKK